MEAKQTTDERILTAFSSLILKYGYKGTTTKKIAAEAGVNESTVFRHYQDKHSILEELVTNYLSDIARMHASFAPEGDLEADLQRIANLYAEFVRHHQAVFLLGLRDAYQFPEIRQASQKLPMRLRALLLDFFRDMVASGEMRADVNVDLEVTNFILINFGNAVFNDVYPQGDMGVPTMKFAKENVTAFARHLK